MICGSPFKRKGINVAIDTIIETIGIDNLRALRTPPFHSQENAGAMMDTELSFLFDIKRRVCEIMLMLDKGRPSRSDDGYTSSVRIYDRLSKEILEIQNKALRAGIKSDVIHNIKAPRDLNRLNMFCTELDRLIMQVGPSSRAIEREAGPRNRAIAAVKGMMGNKDSAIETKGTPELAKEIYEKIEHVKKWSEISMCFIPISSSHDSQRVRIGIGRKAIGIFGFKDLLFQPNDGREPGRVWHEFNVIAGKLTIDRLNESSSRDKVRPSEYISYSDKDGYYPLINRRFKGALEQALRRIFVNIPLTDSLWETKRFQGRPLTTGYRLKLKELSVDLKAFKREELLALGSLNHQYKERERKRIDEIDSTKD